MLKANLLCSKLYTWTAITLTGHATRLSMHLPLMDRALCALCSVTSMWPEAIHIPALLCAASHSWEVSAIQEGVHLHQHLCWQLHQHLPGHYQLELDLLLWLVRVPGWGAMTSAPVLLLSL